MCNCFKSVVFVFLIILFIVAAGFSVGNYKNFKTAVYCRAYETREMGDLSWLESRWETISQQLKVDKIYLETHRDMLIVDEETITKAKKFFKDRGIETAGGITLTVNERNRFQTFCYSNPEHR